MKKSLKENVFRKLLKKKAANKNLVAYLRIHHDSKFILFEDSSTLEELMQTIMLIN